MFTFVPPAIGLPPAPALSPRFQIQHGCVMLGGSPGGLAPPKINLAVFSEHDTVLSNTVTAVNFACFFRLLPIKFRAKRAGFYWQIFSERKDKNVPQAKDTEQMMGESMKTLFLLPHKV